MSHIDQDSSLSSELPEPEGNNVDQELNVDIPNPYGYCDQSSSFGIKKKGKFYPKSDFGLELTRFVKAGSLTGYYCNVTHEITGETRCALCHSYYQVLYQYN